MLRYELNYQELMNPLKVSESDCDEGFGTLDTFSVLALTRLRLIDHFSVLGIGLAN